MSEQPTLIAIGDGYVSTGLPHPPTLTDGKGKSRARPPKPPVPTFAEGDRVTVCVEDSDEAAEVLAVVKVIARAYVVGVSDADTDPIHYSRTTLRQKHTFRDIRIRKYRDGDEPAVVLRELRKRQLNTALALEAANAAVESALANIQETRAALARWEDVRQLRERVVGEKATALAAIDAEIAAMTEAP